MKGIVKALIAGGVIIAIGVALLVIGLALNGWAVKEFEMKRYEADKEYSSINVNFGAGNLKTVFYDGDYIAVDYPEAKGYSFEIKGENEELSLTTKSEITMFSFGLIKWEIPETVIYLPKDIVFDVDLELGAGCAEVESGKYGNVEVKVGAGTLTIGDMICSDFKAEVSAGEFKISKIECEKTDVKVSAGKFEISSLLCPEIYADVSAGSIKILVTGVKAEYGIEASESAGSCNLSSQTGTTDKKIEAHCSAGSINISFTN